MRCKAIPLAILMLGSRGLLAQEAPSAPAPITTPSLPDNADSPTDFQGAGTLPADGGDDGGGAAGAPAGAGGYTGGDLVIGDGSADKYTTREPDYLPEFHVVREGDTLWRICDYYYRDPWKWPEVWAKNKQITNPHWIYTGDRVKLVGGRRAPAREQGEPLVRLGGQAEATSDITLQQNGFIDPEQLEAAGEVVGSKAEHAMLTLGDEVYLTGGERFKPEVGKIYTIYNVREELEDDGENLGHIVDILGTARVKRVKDNGAATAVIMSAVNPIERGARVGPLRRTYKRVTATPAKKTMDGRVLAYLRPSVWAATEDLVFLNRGRADGVELGNRFLVTRRGDGHRRIYQEKERDDPRFPLETVAEIAVLDTRAHASVGLVTRAIKEIRRGDDVRMRRGY